MLGQEREGNVFEPFAFPGVRMKKYCPGFGWEGVGTRCDLLSGLRLGSGRGRDSPYCGMQARARACESI